MDGLMVGDYVATTFDAHGVPHNVFAVAAAKSGTQFNEAMFTAQGLTVAEDGPHSSHRRGIALYTGFPAQLKTKHLRKDYRLLKDSYKDMRK